MPLAITYPTQLEFHGKPQIARWRPLVQWFLTIPHLFIAYALTMVRAVLTLIAFFTVLITGEYPQQLRDFLIGVYRYGVRAQAYTGLLTDQYPPFSLQAG